MKNTVSTDLNRSIQEGNVLFDNHIKQLNSTQKTLDQSGYVNPLDIIDNEMEEEC